MKQKDLLFLLVSSALLAVVWVAFTILHSILTSTISQSVNQQIIPINGSFDEKTIHMLQTRQQVTPQFSIQGTNNITNTPTPLPIFLPNLTPPATSSATTIPNPSITQEVTPSP